MTRPSLSKAMFFAYIFMIIFGINSCKKKQYKRIEPLFLSAFKGLEESSFVLIDQAHNDSIIFNVSTPQLSYEDLLYSNVILENYTLTASTSINIWSNMQISIKVDSNNFLSIRIDLVLHNGTIPSSNDLNGFLLTFADTVSINGVEYNGVLTNVSNNPSTGQVSSIEYSPKFGVLRVVSKDNGAVYVRCFDCD